MSRDYRNHQIIKHALEHYVKRENADKNDLIVENNLLEKYKRIVKNEQQKYGIKANEREG